jgi:DNA-binding beta-propeller fold protein YncE
MLMEPIPRRSRLAAIAPEEIVMTHRLSPSLALSAALIACGGSRAAADPILYFSDAAAGQVVKDVLNGDGKPGTQSVFATVAMATGLAFDAKGNLFVASQNGNTVTKIAPDGTSSAFLDRAAGVVGPQGLAFDASGNLYVANNDSRVREYDASGKLVQTIATDPSPFGLAFDAKGNLFVATLTRDIVDEFTFTDQGVKMTAFRATRGNGLFGVAVDKAGIVYVSGISSNTVDKLDPSDPANMFMPFLANDVGLDRPQGLAFDASGNLYVANQGGGSGSVLEFSSAGKALGAVTQNNKDGVAIKTPVFLAFAPEPPSVALLATGLIAALGGRALRMVRGESALIGRGARRGRDQTKPAG